ncbi:hypothetical protein CGC21_11865 [Leishmania donovani]|uniref:BAR domain-containing protein n=2 Tax=Leishmania donovani TaxID=5661 RepID=A0A504X438_LEIDO|nr:hypothetical protein CGC21_11865 [Leishmania donovani]
MSMQQDFVHPRQMDDMRAIHAAINSFSGVMTKMMMLMKELGTTLEQVSHAFDALTSLSFTDDEVKQYVHHFGEEVISMKEGIAFCQYNKLVHEDVLHPVEQLKKSLKEAEKAAKAEKSAFEKYRKAKQCVDKQEKAFAERSKPLDTSKSYPTHVQARNKALVSLQNCRNEFEDRFAMLVNEVENVTATALKRYLELNAGYMTSVVDALTKTDPTIEEAAVLHCQEQQEHRQSVVEQRCLQVNSELSIVHAPQGYRLDPNGMNGGLHDSIKKSSNSFQDQHRVSSTVSRGQPPRGRMPSPAMTAVEGGAPSPHRGASAVVSLRTLKPTAEAATATTAAVVAAPPSAVEDNADDEDFGSISQVGIAGREAPPLYTFGRGPQSVVSSAPPQPGYIASHNAALTTEFMTRMEANSIAASEVCAPR